MTAFWYDLIFTLPMGLLMLFWGEPYLELPEQKFLVYPVIFLTMGIWLSMVHRKNRTKYLLPGILLTLVFGVVLVQKPEARGEFLFEHRWILWVFLTGSAGFLIGKLIAIQKKLRLAATGGILIHLIASAVRGYTLGKAETALEIFLILVSLLLIIQEKWEKSGDTEGEGHLVWNAPFLAAACLLVFLIPAPEKPYDWKMFVRIWENATEQVNFTISFLHRKDEDYRGTVGFSEDGGFLGNLQHENKAIMILNGKQNAYDSIYLAGRVLDTFDGRAWSNVHESRESEGLLDCIETLSAVEKYDPDRVGDYMRMADLSLVYLQFHTRYLFAPIKTRKAEGISKELSYSYRNGSLISASQLGYKAEYSVYFYWLNQKHEVFEEFLRQEHRTEKDGWENARQYLDSNAGKLGNDKKDATSYEEYLKYHEEIYRNYTEKCDISPRTEELLNQLTEGASTQIDKLLLIEKMLNGMTYSSSPGALPESVKTPGDFLDYFLFRKQEGYCSHYATAFVLLARQMGIPSRYVEGYSVTMGKNRSVTVTSDMAHAWPEAYIDGVGWLTFEPTPGRAAAAAWNVKREEKKEQISDTNPGHQYAPVPVKEPEKETEEEEENESFMLNPRVIGLPLALSLLCILLFVLLDRILTSRAYEKLDIEGKFRVLCRRNLKILRYLGYSLEDGETLEELRETAQEELDPLALAFLEDYEKLLYSGKKPGTLELENLEKSCGLLFEALRAEKGKLYFWYRLKTMRLELGKRS
ncbi:MAG: hypothetical protein J5898_09530 [Lachnospiraceae bacterium]|nr:hypothetical protein [Lachnospiraceae bacterium]